MTALSPRDPDFAARVRASFDRQQFMGFLGAELTGLHPGLCEIQLAYRPELGQQHGYFHAGVVGTLADNSCGYAAYSLMPADWSILTVEYKLNLLVPGDGERLLARGQVVKSGRTLTICRSDVFVYKDGVEKLCAISQQTLVGLAGKSDGPRER
jgi:uncharacterized protein (TIGR00369 family)